MTKSFFKFFVLFSLIILCSNLTQAQESVNASGNDAAGSGGSVSYSVGQVAYTSNTANSGTISQGVQQAYEIIPLGDNETSLGFSLTYFPNPTTNFLILNIDDYKNEKLKYYIFDEQGKIINSDDIQNWQTTIDMSRINMGVYFIEIKQDEKKLKSFKVIKN